MSDLEQRLAAIEARNARVEIDKAWEISWCRRLFIAGVTYIVALLLLSAARTETPVYGALLPVAGFLLSTLSLPVLKGRWVSFCHSRVKHDEHN